MAEENKFLLEILLKQTEQMETIIEAMAGNRSTSGLRGQSPPLINVTDENELKDRVSALKRVLEGQRSGTIPPANEGQRSGTIPPANEGQRSGT